MTNTNETMTLTRAITELKTLTNRFNSFHTDDLIRVLPKNKTDSVVDTALDKFNGMMSRMIALKKAITKANSETFVKIKGKDYTIAEAISLRVLYNEVIDNFHNVHIHLSRARSTADQKNEESRNNAFESLVTSDRPNSNDESLEAMRKVINKHLIDTELQVYREKDVDKINAMRDNINDFLMEIDFVLSEINATTMIVVNDGDK